MIAFLAGGALESGSVAREVKALHLVSAYAVGLEQSIAANDDRRRSCRNKVPD